MYITQVYLSKDKDAAKFGMALLKMLHIVIRRRIGHVRLFKFGSLL